MSLREKTLFGTEDKVAKAIDRLRYFEPKRIPYYLAFSGGKDSVTIKKLADMAGVAYEAIYNVTTIDPPELVRFIRDNFPDIRMDHPAKSFLSRLSKRGFPLRHRRWCCHEFKERGGHDRLVITGIRWAESHKRAGRRMYEVCYRDKTKFYLNVIIDWTDDEVWEFIRHYDVPYCELYDLGWKRIGCLFCPMATTSHRRMELERYPRYRAAFLRAFEKLWEYKKTKGQGHVERWADGKEMFEWWVSGTRRSREPDQGVLFE